MSEFGDDDIIEITGEVLTRKVLVAALIHEARSISVTRASENARELALRPGALPSDCGLDIVNLTLKIPREDTDVLLTFLGRPT